jgi:DNA-binding NarL/FixJ family response regulator
MSARITVLLADDLEVVGEASQYDEVVAGAECLQPQVLVTDIRMAPTLGRERIDSVELLPDAVAAERLPPEVVKGRLTHYSRLQARRKDRDE